jgi:Asp-tRNA(Asn)/Glu-tRNA(Gln) amidotransferase A subunit family amidase
MVDLELCYLPAGEALRRFKAKKLSPVDLMKAVIARAEATKKKINAFTTHISTRRWIWPAKPRPNT